MLTAQFGVFKYSHGWFLGVFAKLRKATVSFVMSVRVSVRLHGTAGLPLDGIL